MAKISAYTEDTSASPQGWVYMAVLQPDGSYATKKVAPGKLGIVGPRGPQGISDVPGPAGADGTNGVDGATGAAGTPAPFQLGYSVTDETSDLTVGDSKFRFRIPGPLVLTAVRAHLNHSSSSGIVTVNVNKLTATGADTFTETSIFSVQLTVDVAQRSSVTAAVQSVLAITDFPDETEFSVDIDVAGTGAKGLKLWMIGAFA